MAVLPDLKRECRIRTELSVATVELLGARVKRRMKLAIRPPSECRSVFVVSPLGTPLIT